MSDFPISFGDLPSTIISSTSSNSLAGEAVIMTNQTAASSTWPAANRAIYVPFIVETSFTVAQTYVYNGTVVAGNVDIGVYNTGGVKVVSSGATAQAGTSTIQLISITNTALRRGLYYMGLMITSATATVFRSSVSLLVLQAKGVFQDSTAGALPSTMGFADLSSSFLPVFGLVSVATA